mmetsp:Transcript_46289/g.99109  ORF Transcript_46289/g.99109 Transcript_46289/m.99109 type:complete len:342 (+) Transcript_46289:1531-2556(+)
MGRRDAEADTLVEHRAGRVAHENDGNPSFQAHARESRHLVRVVEHDRDDWRIQVSQDLEAFVCHAPSEVVRVFSDARQLLCSDSSCIATRDYAECLQCLHCTRRWHRPSKIATRCVAAKRIDDVPGGSDIASSASEGLREGAHHDLYFAGWNAQELSHSPASLADGTDRMGLVQIQEGLVLVLQADNLSQPAEVSLHRVDTFDDDEDLPPRLLLAHSSLKLRLQVRHHIVLERANCRTREPDSLNDRTMVEFITQHQHATCSSLCIEERWEDATVRCEAHTKHDGILLAQIIRNLLLQIKVDLHSAALGTWGTWAPALGESCLSSLRHAKLIYTTEAQVVV